MYNEIIMSWWDITITSQPRCKLGDQLISNTLLVLGCVYRDELHWD